MAVVQTQTAVKSEGSTVTSSTVTFGSTATSGNVLIVAISIDKDGGTVTAPSGWSTAIVVKADTSITLAYSYKISDGTETNAAFSWTTTHTSETWFGEYSGLTGTTPNQVANANSGATAVKTQTTGTTATTTAARTYSFAFWAMDTAVNTDSDRAYTNNFSELLYTLNGGSGLSVAVKENIATLAAESTFTCTDASGDQIAAAILAWEVDDTIASIEIVQKDTVSTDVTATSRTTTFAGAATSGNMLFTAIAIDKDAGTVTVPTGFTLGATIKADTSITLAWAYKVSLGTETTITWNYSNTKESQMYSVELSGVDGTSPDTSSNANSGVTSVTSQTTGTTGTTSQANTLTFGIWGIDTASNADDGRAYTNLFLEDSFLNLNTSSGLVVAKKELASTQTVEGTFSTTGGGDQMAGAAIVWRAAAVGGGGTKTGSDLTRLSLYGGARKQYGSFAGKVGGGGAPTIPLGSMGLLGVGK